MTDTQTPVSGDHEIRSLPERISTVRHAVTRGLYRAVGERRLKYDGHDIDAMANSVVSELRAHQKSIRHRKAPGLEPGDLLLLELLAHNFTYQDIAREARRPRPEVNERIQILYGLLGAENRLAAVVAAYELGLLRPGEAIQR